MSQVCFAPSENLLLCASWDASLRLYDVDAKRAELVKSMESDAAVLCCAFVDNARAVSGGLDKAVKVFDLAKGDATALGDHDDAVRAVVSSDAHGLVMSGSWDCTIRAWDNRGGGGGSALSTVRMPGKVYSMAMQENKLVASSSGQAVWIFDVRNMSVPLQQRESSLKYQTRCVAIGPGAEGYAMGSIEGRVAIEYFDQDPHVQERKYAFKCHRKGDIIYPVNAIAFHPVHGTFATGGCDGGVNIWDGVNRKRISALDSFPTSVASLAFNHDGSLLAIASSYTFEQGDVEHPPDEIFIHAVEPSEVRPKQRRRGREA